MGLKGYRLWIMGQLDSNLHRPTTSGAGRRQKREIRGVAVRVALERHTLKPGIHLIGSRVGNQAALSQAQGATGFGQLAQPPTFPSLFCFSALARATALRGSSSDMLPHFFAFFFAGAAV
jgi:hypothetical protein